MRPSTTIGVSAARAAGQILLRNLSRLDRVKIHSKQRNDFVSDVDIAAEQEIITQIKKAYPAHSILAEESGNTSGDDYTWIIDPLDGTTNFLRGFPQFCVSIALKHKNRLELGIIYDPLKEELFIAERGNGATLNNHKIRVSNHKELSGALIGTGLPYREDQELDLYLSTLRSILQETSGVRRAGSAALDLAYVAAGRFDGFWEFGLNTWDIAAGVLLIQEAGGMVCDPQGGHDYLDSGDVIAANARLFKPFLRTLHAAIKTARTTE